MADGLPIPPWIANLPDPVASYSHGLSVGVQVGEAQAKQQLAQEQMLREEQKDLVEEQIQQAKFQLQSDAAARRYAAQQQFDRAIQSGVDPATAALKFGPGMGITGPALAQFSKELQKPQLNVQTQDGEMFVQTGQGFQHVRRPASTARYFHNADGTVTEVKPDGTTSILGTPSIKPARLNEIEKAKVTGLVKELGDIDKALSPTNLDRLKNPERAQSLMEERLRIKGELSKFERKLQPARALAQPAPVSAPFKIVSIRQKGQTQAPPQESDDTDTEE